MKMSHATFLFLPLFLAIGCSQANDLDDANDSDVFNVPEPIEPIVLKGDVKVMPDSDGLQLNGMSAPTVTAPTEVDADTLENAQFVVGRTLDGDGYLRKVGEMKVVDGREVAVLEPATLDEVIEHGDWKFELPAASDEEIEAAPFITDEDLELDTSVNPEGMNLLGTKTKSAVFKFNLGGKSLSAPSTVAGDFSVKIEEGTLTYSPSVTIGGEHRGGKISQFSFVSKGKMRVRMKVSANLTKGVSKGGNKSFFPSVKHAFGFMIGAVPVAGTLQFDVNGGLSINSSVSGKVSTLVDCTFPITVGGRYTNGKWTKASSPQVTCTSSPLTGSAQGTAGVKVSVKPELSVRLYGVVGPAVDLEPYLKASTTFTPKPKKCSYSMLAGLASTFSVSAKLFKWTITAYETSLFDKSKTLRSGTYCQ